MRLSVNSSCFMSLLAILRTCFASTDYKILSGLEGVGKSYIATLNGCTSVSCAGSSQCTADSKICENGVMDTIGINTAGEYEVIDDEGRVVKLSGMWYPIYNMLLKLERAGTSSASFFLVEDANNPRTGGSVNQYVAFMKDVFGCQMTRVVNKYREDFEAHQRIIQQGDIIVKEGQKSAVPLTGSTCNLVIPRNWKKLVLSRDLTAIMDAIKYERCSSLRRRKAEVEAQISPDEGHDRNECKYWGETGGRWCRGIKIFGKCSDWEPNRGWKTDHDCIRRRDEANHQVNIRNSHRAELRGRLNELALQINSQCHAEL